MPYVNTQVGEDFASFVTKPTQTMLDAIIKAIKTDVLDGKTHINQALRYIIKIALWRSGRLGNMEKASAMLEMSLPFVVIDPKIIKAYQQVRYLTADGIAGNITAAQLLKDLQLELRYLKVLYKGKPPETYNYASEFTKRMLTSPYTETKLALQKAAAPALTPVITYRASTAPIPGFTVPPVPQGNAQKYTAVVPPQGVPTTQYQSSPAPTLYSAGPTTHYGQGGAPRARVRQMQIMKVRPVFSWPAVMTAVAGTLMAIYSLRILRQYGPAVVGWVNKKRRGKRRGKRR